MKKLFLLAFAAFALAACSDKPEHVNPPVVVPEPVLEVVDFEDVQLGSVGFIWGKDQATLQAEDPDGRNTANIFYGVLYSEKVARFVSYYNDYKYLKPETPIDSWNGFIISNRTDRTTAGYENDKSVYAEGGAGGSKQFAVGYYGAETLKGRGVPTIRFRIASVVSSVDIAHTTYAYLYFTKDIATAEKPGFDLIITGFSYDKQTASITVPMVKGQTVTQGWETVDLTPLGKVSSMTFTVSCGDMMAPAYFCIDKLTYQL